MRLHYTTLVNTLNVNIDNVACCIYINAYLMACCMHMGVTNVKKNTSIMLSVSLFLFLKLFTGYRVCLLVLYQTLCVMLLACVFIL